MTHSHHNDAQDRRFSSSHEVKKTYIIIKYFTKIKISKYEKNNSIINFSDNNI